MTIASLERGGKGRSRPLSLALLAVGLCLLAAAPARGAADWLKPADLSKPGRDAFNPVIGMDSAGNTIAIWERQSTVDASINLQIATRAPGGDFSAPADFTLRSTEPDLAMAPGGEAVAVWKHFENPPGVYVIQAAIRPPGGSFSAPINVYTAAPSVIPQEVDVALGETGNVAVTWNNVDPNSGFDKIVCGVDPMTEIPFKCPNPSFVQASVRTGGGSFSPAKRISPPRFVHPPPPEGETEKEKEEREEKEEEIDKEESKKSAAGGRIAIDSAGNAVAVWTYFDGEDAIVQSAAAPGGAAFGAPVQVSESGEDSFDPVIAMDAGGNAVAAWMQSEGADRVIEAATRPAGGGFNVLGAISNSGGLTEAPTIAVNSGGTATVAWRFTGFSESFIQAATMPPGGTFAKPVSISSGKDNPLFPEVAMNNAGSAVVAWSGDNGASEITRASVRPAGGDFGAPMLVSQSSADLFHPHVAMGGGGDTTAIWTRYNGVHDIAQAAGYDAAPPSLNDVSIPALGKVGQTLAFSASSSDAWPIGQPHFSFGDGSEADGNAVSHAFSTPGTYVVRITATDAAGTPTTAAGTTLVKALNDITIAKLTRNRRTGTAKLAVTVPEP
ncbi:MAG TPA: PKD domain-containing protein, partial [Thermoanaerobaculia bacterium]